MQLEEFITIEKKDGIATIWLDSKREKMNVVSPAVIELFDALMDKIEGDPEILAAVFISKKADFMAGADIKAFAIEKEGDFRPFQEQGHRALDRIEQCRKPFVSAVHGTAFGLGTELSLACHARIATRSSRTKFALPEVKLGLLPGGGGTQRLPRLIGIQKALDMMLAGKNIFAYRAQKMGLVDELTEEGKLHQAAVLMARRLLKKPMERPSKLSLAEKLLEGNPLGRKILFSQARKMAYQRSQGNYPAIPAIIDCVETGIEKGLKAGYEKELELFEKLMLTPESAALRALFFAMADNKKNPYADAPKKLDTLGMIGAGFMGAGIAEVSLTKGVEVLLKDINQEVASHAQQQIWQSLQKKVKQKALTKVEAEALMGNLHAQLDYDNFDKADIVIEAVLEKMSLKQQIIKDVETHCRADVIMASNTSSLSLTEMAAHAQRPDTVIGMHYFSPVPKMPLLEIVKTDKTADWVIAACYDFGIRQGKTCIVVQDGPSFYVNRILSPYTNECLLMADEGIALEAIDKAFSKKGFPVGPITLLDQVGLDIAAHVTDTSRKIVAGRPGFEICEAVVKMFEAGRLGKKNKKGFYNYNDKGRRLGIDPTAYQFFQGDGKQALPLEEIQNRGLMLMLNEAVLCLEEGIIANPGDGDLGAVFGIGFPPFTGGPFRAMDTWGIQHIVDTMRELQAKYGPRFAPAATLERMAGKGEEFYR
ncbi:MAG: enoyl-CoA hydratase/isomerase family protein [Lewinellaceae bacterium]|nr:enoyl-CoA hydratase/isomerase family protein [Phaeodactylibacter sp.]MCB9352699.1 enoyl-CoA hydratase/isomerase family protein [Lewinellaceae bacterium]